ncbi:MAG: radical SAM protein [Planctomycetales bacterium]
MNVLLVSPQTPDTFWSFKHALKFISRKAAFPPLGLLTIATLLPKSWNLRLVDLNVARLDDGALLWADYVMISGMIVHRASVDDVVARARRLGRPVIGGGPLFTTGGDEFGDAVHCVVGEAEELIETLAADMRAGTLQRRYVAAGWPDVGRAPIPDWDLIDLRNYGTMPVQFSRGCPYDCEFCDVTIMNGRRPRTKSPEQVLAEIDALVDRGWREQIFLVDDNFIGNKVRVKELLRELIRWGRGRGTRLEFFTQASLNLADDPELLDLMVRAGFRRVFLGIETPHSASLDECHKV